MHVQDIMTGNPACCRPDSTLTEVARLMAEHDCGAIPVVDDERRPQGIVTDRDICCRGVAEGMGGDTRVAEVMTRDVLTVTADDEIESCCDKMEEKQVRRAVVVDGDGRCCGMLAQADIARAANDDITAELVRDVSL